MKKGLLLGLSVLGLVLAGCEQPGSSSSSSESDSSLTTSETSSSSSSSSEVASPVHLTQDELVTLLTDALNSSISAYTSTSRQYMDSYIDGTIYNNSLETIAFELHEDGFDSVSTLSTPSTPTSISADEPDVVGRYAAYKTDENTYIRGFLGENSDVNDFYEYHEFNIYTDMVALGRQNYETMLNSAISKFGDPEGFWDPDLYGYTIGEFTAVDNEEDQTVTYSIMASAPETEWYAREEQTIEAIISYDGTEIMSVYSTTFLYDMGATSTDKDESANNYQYNAISDIVFGEVSTDAITPFDINNFDVSMIYNAPQQVVENIPDGNISTENVQAILGNWKAYQEGIVSASTEEYATGIYDADWNELPPAIVTTTSTLYQDYILISESTFDFTDDVTPNIEEYTQNVAGEEGVEIMKVSGETSTGTFVDGAYVSEMDAYFNPSPILNDLSLTECFSFVAANGFVEIDGGYIINSAEFVSANKDGNTITIELVYNAEFPGIYDNSYSLEMTIEDDFITYIDFTETNQNTYSHYTMVKGEPTQFTGELIPFEETVYPY